MILVTGMKQNEKPEKVKVSAFLASAQATLISTGTGVRAVRASGKPWHLGISGHS